MIRKILLFIDGTLLFLTLLIGINYSYYVANIKYVNHTQTVILSDLLNLKAEDGKEIKITNLKKNESFIKTFCVENTTDKDAMFNLLFKNTTSTIGNSLVYEIYEKDKLLVSQTIVPLTSDASYIKTNIKLKAEEAKEFILKFTLLEEKEGIFSSNIEINSLQVNGEIKTATNYLLAKNEIMEENNTQAGLYKTTDTNTNEPSYYFKGDVLNNYVLFAGDLFRIVRINEDGSIRIIKDAALPSNETPFSFDAKKENAYLYKESAIKNQIDMYYNSVLKPYENMIKEEPFCEELHVVKNNNFKINENNRNYNEYTPTLKCNQETNLMIGLLSYDEAVLSGLSYGSNRNEHYLLKSTNPSTWMISPAGVYNLTQEHYAFRIANNNNLNEVVVTEKNITIRPVINIKPTLNVTGNGTIDNPYIFSV